MGTSEQRLAGMPGPGIRGCPGERGGAEGVCVPGAWSAVAQSWLTATSSSRVQGIPLPQPPEYTVHAQEQSPSATASNVATSHSTEKVDGDTQTTVEKDGLATVTLVGIIVGVLLAIGFIGGIIIVVMRKMTTSEVSPEGRMST
uniref:Podoplanin n=1 Tax=Nomascus leucogenys TaxID=61853 RepID=A0A2I3GMU1_NOMLE